MIRRQLKLPLNCAMLEVDIADLAELAGGVNYQPINRFPALQQDLTLRATTSVSYQTMTNLVTEHLNSEGGRHGYMVSIEPLDIFQKVGDSGSQQTTWRIRFEHPERTLTTDEANRLIESLAAAAKKKLKADRV
jgi:phenylalanyl-tRNA synthetase beta subunit